MLGHGRSSITSHDPQRRAARRGPGWGAAVVVMVTLALLVGHHPGQAAVLGPSGPRAPGPGGIITGTPYNAPTRNLTAVAQGLYVGVKSLSLLVAVAPGLRLTQPVTISIGYASPVPGVPNRLTQVYRDPAKPPYLLYNDAEGDGNPRTVHMDITLTEPKPGGGIYSFNVPADVGLDPLYDIKIDPATFWLAHDCAWPGPTLVDFRWLTPDKNDWTNASVLLFNIHGGKQNTIVESAWSKIAVSASSNLHMPLYVFDSTAGGPFAFHRAPSGGDPSQAPRLIPGHTQRFQPTLRSTTDSECWAVISYTITYWIHRYSAEQLGYHWR